MVFPVLFQLHKYVLLAVLVDSGKGPRNCHSTAGEAVGRPGSRRCKGGLDCHRAESAGLCARGTPSAAATSFSKFDTHGQCLLWLSSYVAWPCSMSATRASYRRPLRSMDSRFCTLWRGFRSSSQLPLHRYAFLHKAWISVTRNSMLMLDWSSATPSDAQ